MNRTLTYKVTYRLLSTDILQSTERSVESHEDGILPILSVMADMIVLGAKTPIETIHSITLKGED